MKKNNSNKVKLGASDKIVRGFGYVVITIYALACIFPFLLILGSSFTAEEVIRTEGVQLIPKQFTLAAYEMVCKGGGIWKSYLLTIILTVVGTAVMHCREKISRSATEFPSTYILQACFPQDLHRTIF